MSIASLNNLEKSYGKRVLFDKLNLNVYRGERIGLMKFGSRMDVFLPPDAELRVSVGERTIAGETILATMGSAGAR